MTDKIDSSGTGELTALAGNSTRLEALAVETRIDLKRLRQAASGQVRLSRSEAASVAAALRGPR